MTGSASRPPRWRESPRADTDGTATGAAYGSRVDDGDEPQASADHPSAAVRLLRSVAPWTAPNPVGAEAAPSSEASNETDRDRSINGPGIPAEAMFVFFFFLFGALLNTINHGPDQDAPSIDVSTVIIVAGVGGIILLAWIRRLATRARLRRDGMRAQAVVTHVHPSSRPRIVGHGVVYRYQTQGGTHRGHATLGRNVPPKKLGDHIPILYDIAHQDVSLVE